MFNSYKLPVNKAEVDPLLKTLPIVLADISKQISAGNVHARCVGIVLANFHAKLLEVDNFLEWGSESESDAWFASIRKQATTQLQKDLHSLLASVPVEYPK